MTMRFAPLILLGMLYSSLLFALPHQGVRLGPFRIFPSLTYQLSVEKSENRDKLLNKIMTKVNLYEGTGKLALGQNVLLAYTHEQSKKYDLEFGATARYDTKKPLHPSCGHTIHGRNHGL